MSALQWAADYQTLPNAFMHRYGLAGSIISRLNTQKPEHRGVQVPAQGHTAQKHQAESPTPPSPMLPPPSPKLSSLAS